MKLDLDDLEKLRVPCILHWEFNHFVVLKSADAKGVTIHDPSVGVRVVSWNEASNCFTGVALEFWPTNSFKPQIAKQTIHIRSLMGRVSGMFASCAQILVLALALEFFALLAPFFVQWVIDNAIFAADRDLLATLALGFGVLMLMQHVISAIRAWTLLYMGTTLNVQWRANVFAHLIRLPVQYFEKRHLGDVVSRFGSTDVIQRTLTTSFLEAILDGFMAIAAVIIMFIYSPLLCMIALGAMSMYCLVRYAWFRPLRRATEEQIVHSARQESHLLETVRGVKVIKLFQRHDERRSTWLALVVDQVNAELRTAKLQLFYKFINGLLFGIENILIVWIGARLVIDGNFSVGVLTAFMAYKGQFVSRVSALIDKVFELKMLQLHGERLADIVLTEPEVIEGAHQLTDEDAIAPSIAVRGLQFRYSQHEPNVLSNISFEIPSGTAVAIVGPSGCGKTTLMNVLLGVLQPTDGEILVGGVPLRRLGVEGFRRMVGTVLQDDVLFSGSIADNICFFDSKPDRSWIAQCAELAAVAADIREMPMGYSTLVGDMGTVLSGGQKQRVLLARALYKRPLILFLDEATSHLDIEKERQVNEAVKMLNITRVIIAHRPETIASVGRVIVLAGGCVVHDDVVALSPATTADDVDISVHERIANID